MFLIIDYTFVLNCMKYLAMRLAS